MSKSIGRLTPVNRFTIFNPRWRDRSVLMMDFKIGHNNVITFPKANSLPGEWYISGTEARKYPTEPFTTKTGNTVTMRVVPLEKLETVEWRED